MMIRNDQIHPALACDLPLLDGGDPAVDGDDHLRALVTDLRDRFGIEPVPLVDAMGDVEAYGAAERFDGVPEDRGGGDAVDVVVAVDDDPLAIANRLRDALGGLGKV